MLNGPATTKKFGLSARLYAKACHNFDRGGAIIIRVAHLSDIKQSQTEELFVQHSCVRVPPLFFKLGMVLFSISGIHLPRWE